MRPTLEDQIAISKLQDEECIELLKGKGIKRVDFWIFCHMEALWHIIHLNWFDPLKHK